MRSMETRKELLWFGSQRQPEKCDLPLPQNKSGKFTRTAFLVGYSGSSRAGQDQEQDDTRP